MSERAKNNEAYVDVVSKASLEDILLTGSTFKASLGYQMAKDDEVDRSLGSSTAGCEFDNEILIGDVRCHVLIRKKSGESDDSSELEEDGENLFSVHAVYTVVFNLKGEHDRPTLQAFFSRMAPFAVWPYFRSHVAMLASSANVDVPVLPVKKFVQRVETVLSYSESDTSFGGD